MPEEAEQQALLAAIKTAIEDRGISQRELGAAVAHREGQPAAYPQSTVGAWLRGKAYLRPDRVFTIERILGMRPGTLSKLDGYLPLGTLPPVTPEEAIAADPDISNEQASLISAQLAEARRLTAARRAKRSQR